MPLSAGKRLRRVLRNLRLDTRALIDDRSRRPLCEHDFEGECDACYYDRLAH